MMAYSYASYKYRLRDRYVDSLTARPKNTSTGKVMPRTLDITLAVINGLETSIYLNTLLL